MKDYDFFPGEGKFYKANLHCHTVISDGKLTKEQIREEYRKRGYSIGQDKHSSSGTDG